MSRIIYIHGDYVAEENAKISVFDRGFLFADGIYEVNAVLNGRMIDNDLHLARLARSLKQINIAAPLSDEELIAMQEELIRRNNLKEGIIYLQVTRGEADRDFIYNPDMKSNLIAFTQEKKILDTPEQTDGIAVDVQDDLRWARRDIKSVMLLAQVMAKNQARTKGCQEVWLTEDGYITEGASSSAFILTEDNVLIVRPNSNSILPGCTRLAMLKIAEELQLKIEERRFTLNEALTAKEAYLTSASGFITPIVKIADTIISDGKPGATTKRLQEEYLKLALAE